MKNDLKQHEDFVVPRIPEPPVLKFNGTEFEGVVLSDEVTVSPKEIIDNYEENLDYLLEKYGFSKGSSEYDSLKELLFGVKGERVLKDIVKISNARVVGSEQGMFFTSSGELFLRPDVILSTVGVENEKQFFYKMFREMDYMIYRLKTVFTLKKDEEGKEKDSARAIAEIRAYLSKQDSQFCSDFFSLIHARDLMKFDKDEVSIDALPTKNEDLYLAAQECAEKYNDVMVRYRERCQDKVKSGTCSKAEADQDYSHFHRLANESLLTCSTQKQVRAVIDGLLDIVNE